ncbi:MAG: hypothetical protein R3C18_27815 [Planctomycetaceae bacterium]
MNNSFKLIDSFWTSGLVSQIDEFHGRDAELGDLQANIKRSGIAISGSVGVGKSSLLSIMRVMLEGFNTGLRSACPLAMCSTGDEPWQLAKKLIHHFRHVTEKKVVEWGFDLKGVAWKETKTASELSGDDHISALIELLLELSSSGNLDYLVCMFDESHKCPNSLAELVRTLKERLEHDGVPNIRFIAAGIDPFVSRMIQYDSGIGRAFQCHIALTPWDVDTTRSFVEEKLGSIIDNANAEGNNEITYSDGLSNVIYRLSGGHPFLVQLLGSYLVRHENAVPDGLLDVTDLVGALREICMRTRRPEYNSMIEALDMNQMLEAYQRMVESLSTKSPSTILPTDLIHIAGIDGVKWFLDNGYIFEERGLYRLTDELLRVALLLEDGGEAALSAREQTILFSQRRQGERYGHAENDFDDDDFDDDDFDDDDFDDDDAGGV